MCNCAYLVLPFIITSMFFNVLVLSWCQTQMHQFLLILCDQVTSYAHGSSDLLGIQIDAAINPGALYMKLCFYLFVLLLCQFSYFSSQICSCLKLQTFFFLNDVFPLSLSFFEPYLILPSILGNSGGPAFNDQGECIGVAFQVNFWSAVKFYISFLISPFSCSHGLSLATSQRLEYLCQTECDSMLHQLFCLFFLQ